MRKLLLCAGAAVACVNSVAIADTLDPGALLVKAAEASRTTNYQGVVIYRGDESFEVLRVQHRFKDNSERERMISLTGEPRQLLRIDNRLICILPKGHMMSVERPALKGFLAQLTMDRVQDLKQWYDFKDQGQGRIAGRPCNGVAIAPRDGFRYGYEVWTDQESRLPLKISLTGPRGEVLEQVMFTEVSFPDSIPDDAFEAQVDPRKYNLVTRNLPALDAPSASPAIEHDKPQIRLEKLPPGFKIVAHDDRALPDGSGVLEHLTLSDGLSAVSVFSELQQHEEKVFSGVSHIGPVQAYGRMVGSMHITIVGEVPQQTIRMIGDGLRLPVAAPDQRPAPGAAASAPAANATPPVPAVVPNRN